MADKRYIVDDLPRYTPFDQHVGAPRRRRSRRRLLTRLTVCALIAYAVYSQWRYSTGGTPESSPPLDWERLETEYATCAKLRHVPQDPSGHRHSNARHVADQKPVLIRNATVWTGMLFMMHWAFRSDSLT